MQRLWRLATANWRASPGRTFAIVLSVALGVGTIALTTSFYETARRGVTDEVVTHWLGAAHITVHPVGAHWAGIDASIADGLASLDNVRHVTARLVRRARLVRVSKSDPTIEAFSRRVDAIGINWETEHHFRSLPNLQGRMFTPGERGAAVIEAQIAGSWGMALGDTVVVTPYYGGPKATLKVVGLFDSQRVAEFQLPVVYLPLDDLQVLTNEPATATAIDLMLDDPSPDALDATTTAVKQWLAQRGLSVPYRVETAKARQLVLAEAERITRMSLMLMAFVALLTAFFVIISTQSVSLVRRQPQLGIMRCIGLTRRQMAGLVLLELLPPGLVGTVLGLAGGLAATRAAEYAAGDVVIRIYHSPWGLQLAAISGIATTLLSAALLVIQVGRVGPLDAVNVQARPVRRRLIYAVSLFGAALLICFQAMISSADGTQWLDPLFAGAGTSALYLGFALAAPAMIVWLGRPMARGVGWMMRLQPGLAEDPFVRAPWRTTGACWVLMVGLSLIVYIAARAEGVLAVWDFPARLPEAFVWSPSYVSGETIERVRRLSGLVNTTVVTDVTCDIAKPGDERPSPARSLFETIVRQVTKPVFVAGDPDKLLGMIKVAFTEGSFDEAIVRLRRGGAVLIPTQTARNHDLHLGDRIAVTVKGRRAEFEIAGVVQSPALDLAVTAFQAQSYMQFAAASAILGTRRDLIDKFDLDVVSMFMFDMDLPATPMPEDFAQQMMQDMTDDLTATRLFLAWRDRIPEAADVYQRLGRPMTSWAENPKGFSLDADTAGEIERFARALQWTKHSSYTRDYTAEEKWTALRKRLLLAYVRRDMNAPKTVAGSLAHLKRQLEKGLRRAITVITWLPSLMLAVAAIGIANLMMVSVHARARQIAVLRALGALKSQIVRLVLAEAITVGLLGSVLGLALGLYETYSVNRIVAGLIDVSLDFIVPVGTIAAAVALTVTVCLLAAVAPARRAARNNIIQAIQTT